VQVAGGDFEARSHLLAGRVADRSCGIAALSQAHRRVFDAGCDAVAFGIDAGLRFGPDFVRAIGSLHARCLTQLSYLVLGL
jgi:hypothetical protein